MPLRNVVLDLPDFASRATLEFSAKMDLLPKPSHMQSRGKMELGRRGRGDKAPGISVEEYLVGTS